MDLTQIVGLISAAVGVVTIVSFFISQGANLRKAIESGDDAVRADASRSRHDLANVIHKKLGEIEKDMKELEKAAHTRAEAKELELRLGGRLDRFESKLDLVGDKLSSIEGLKVQMSDCLERMKELTGRMSAREKA